MYVTDLFPIFINVTRYPARSTRKRLVTSGLAFFVWVIFRFSIRVCRTERAYHDQTFILPDQGGLKQTLG